MSNDKFILEDRNYGRNGVKLLHVVRNGLVHNVKEIEVTPRLTLTGDKEYLSNQNSDIICSDSFKNTIYILAKNNGIKTPEDFAILLCNHFLSKYDNVAKASFYVEEVMWNRVNYSDQVNVKLHNHAFVHTPTCTRSASAVLKRGEKYPIVSSTIKDLRVLKTTKKSFLNARTDEYRTLPDLVDGFLCLIVDCSWFYRMNPEVDFDKSWEMVKYCILRNFAGDLDEGVQSYSVQNTLYIMETDILEKINQINSIEITVPSITYEGIDFSKFKTLVKDDKEKTVYLPLYKSSGSVVYAKLDRKDKN